MERNFEIELKDNALYQFLRRNNGCKVYWLSQDTGEEVCATFKCTSNAVYFYWSNGTYRRVEMSTESVRAYNSRGLLDDVLRITRVEKEIEAKMVPVWTCTDGFLPTDYQSFVYINERYYTLKELEQIIEEVKSLKTVVANLKVY